MSIFSKIWDIIFLTTVLIVLPGLFIFAVWLGVQQLDEFVRGYHCIDYKIVKQVTPQTNFWGTKYYVLATDGSSDIEEEAPRIGGEYCVEYSTQGR